MSESKLSDHKSVKKQFHRPINLFCLDKLCGKSPAFFPKMIKAMWMSWKKQIIFIIVCH